ncbi:MAG: DUF2332 domain-containing protein [Sphingomonadales bacterium]
MEKSNLAMVTPIEAFHAQIAYCVRNDAPVTAAVCRALIEAIDTTTRTGARVLGWSGNPTADAVPLRLVGGVHSLWQRGVAPELAPLFECGEDDVATMRAFLAQHDAALLPWLDGPPQTNEPGRSAQLMAGLLEIAARHGPRIELLEIGSSAGLNLMIGRYRINLDGVTTGPADSPVVLTPEWRGPPPAAGPIDIVGARGVDIAPVDATSQAGADRLLAYIWADHHVRFERMAGALSMIRADPPRLDAGDAADWVEARLAEPQEAGVTRVLMHSIVWQYIAAEGQARITAAMEAAGARATTERPLGWVRVEADRTVNQHDITLRSWPGYDQSVLYGHAHAHGFWVERVA